MKRHNRILAVVLALIMILGTVPSFAANEVKEVIASMPTFADMPTEGHWSYAALKSAVDNGLMSGSNGLLNPSNNMTRAEMAGIINNAFGAIDEADITAFTDVEKTDWFYSVIAKAVQMKTFAGSGNGLMNPTASIPRQDALVVIAKVLQLQSEDYSVLEKFADKALIAEYAKPYLAALVKAGYVAGSDGKIEPAKLVTREEVAQLLYNVFKTIITKAGTVTGNINGNVLVNAPDVVIKDSKITGDLILADGVGNGDVTLDNVEITGKLIVRGGGEHSIKS